MGGAYLRQVRPRVALRDLDHPAVLLRRAVLQEDGQRLREVQTINILQLGKEGREARKKE